MTLALLDVAYLLESLNLDIFPKKSLHNHRNGKYLCQLPKIS